MLLNEILDILEDDDDPCDVYIEPPSVHELTDDDSADKDEDVGPARLSENKLLANAELRRHERNSHKEENETVDSTSISEPPKKKQRKTASPYCMEKWGR